ncbi:hypothetical protein KDE12_02260 [Campylobacter sp. faydin G-105]|uniref:hypothetical protein n=1 Tax=Campylobacter anatolicus TaxID=2829105 RepID=UPI001B9246DB|nr:hypothetical protein [Campylobacter anatolicus]MBR8461672.1 hypothetical protein [Campylobacter anatolicus]
MNVALVNKNPAVSRLITLSLNKIGMSYAELDSIDGLSDDYGYIIVDSDIDVGEFKFQAPVMALIPRGEQKPEFADVVLEKPFLPTEFLELFENSKAELSNVGNSLAQSGLSDDFSDFDSAMSNFDELESFEIPSIDGDDDFELSNLDDEFTSGSEIDTSDLKSSLEDELGFDETPAEIADDNLDEMATDDVNIDSINLDEPLSDDAPEPFSETEQEGLDRLDDLKFDEPATVAEEKSEIDELSELVDEIDSMNQSQSTEIYTKKSELDELVLNGSDDKSFTDESKSSELGLDKINADGLSDELGDDIIIDEPLNENLDLKVDEPNDSKTSLDDTRDGFDDIDMDKFAAETGELITQDELIADNTLVSSIDEIDESLMMEAFGLVSENATSKKSVVTQSLKTDETNADELKTELREKISEHISASLSESVLKDVLKDMNIKINISFEEK